MQSLEGDRQAVSAQRHGTNRDRDSGASSSATNPRSSLAGTAQTSDDAHASTHWQQGARSRITSAAASSSSTGSAIASAGLAFHENRLRPISDSHARIATSSGSTHSGGTNAIPVSSSSVASLAFSGASFPSTSSLAPEIEAVPQQSSKEGESSDELDADPLVSAPPSQTHLDLHLTRHPPSPATQQGRSLPEGDAMFESTASGLFGRGVAPAPSSSDTRATVSALASSSSTSVGNGGGIGSASAHVSVGSAVDAPAK